MLAIELPTHMYVVHGDSMLAAFDDGIGFGRFATVQTVKFGFGPSGESRKSRTIVI